MVKPHPLLGLAGRATRGVITAANELTRERLGARGNCPKDGENKEKRHHQAKKRLWTLLDQPLSLQLWVVVSKDYRITSPHSVLICCG